MMVSCFRIAFICATLVGAIPSFSPTSAAISPRFPGDPPPSSPLDALEISLLRKRPRVLVRGSLAEKGGFKMHVTILGAVLEPALSSQERSSSYWPNVGLRVTQEMMHAIEKDRWSSFAKQDEQFGVFVVGTEEQEGGLVKVLVGREWSTKAADTRMLEYYIMMVQEYFRQYSATVYAEVVTRGYMDLRENEKALKEKWAEAFEIQI